MVCVMLFCFECGGKRMEEGRSVRGYLYMSYRKGVRLDHGTESEKTVFKC